MEYRFLGKTGLKLSALSYGAWVTFADQINEQMAYQTMKAAYDAGVNFFDNAEVYANGQAEMMMGNIIKKTGWKRSDLVLSTKIFWGGTGPNDRGLSHKHIMEGTHAALKRLQVDYVDLIFCHRSDLYTPVEETVWAMNLLIQQGKAFYWGTSEWPAEKIREAVHIARREHLIPPVMEQPQYNMLTRERVDMEYADLYRDFGLGTTIWSPLASGILTGKYNRGFPADSRLSLPGYEWLKKRYETEEGKRSLEKVKKLTSLADDLGVSLAQLALAWCLKNPHVSTVITGASRPEQVQQNMQALNVVDKLTPEILDKIEEILQNKPKAPADMRNL